VGEKPRDRDDERYGDTDRQDVGAMDVDTGDAEHDIALAQKV
jgi:hypothetical protein